VRRGRRTQVALPVAVTNGCLPHPDREPGQRLARACWGRVTWRLERPGTVGPGRRSAPWQRGPGSHRLAQQRGISNARQPGPGIQTPTAQRGARCEKGPPSGIPAATPKLWQGMRTRIWGRGRRGILGDRVARPPPIACLTTSSYRLVAVGVVSRIARARSNGKWAGSSVWRQRRTCPFLEWAGIYGNCRWAGCNGVLRGTLEALPGASSD
jgi:hypothetical protein